MYTHIYVTGHPAPHRLLLALQKGCIGESCALFTSAFLAAVLFMTADYILHILDHLVLAAGCHNH